MFSQALPIPEPQRRVRVLAPFPVAKAYDYALPGGMTAAPGDYVRVTLGKKETPAVVWSMDGDAVWSMDGDAALDPSKIKPVLEKYDLPPLPAGHRAFLEKAAAYTMSDLGSVLKMTLSAPAVFDPPKEAVAYVLSSPAPSPFSPLPPKRGEGGPKGKQEKREKIISLLSDNIPRRASEIAKLAGCTPAVIKTMAKDGLLRAVPLATPPPGRIEKVANQTLSFSKEQQAAAQTLIARAREDTFSATLLDGVTGSGKTEVYFEAVAEALRRGRQALILLPEIALSAQFLDRFVRRFGESPALWHSEVTPARRRAAWLGAATGETRVVVGARSALFLPFRDLGLIVVDEEHDASYKQEEGVLYNARDMAVLRASLGKFPCVLVSATPSLETATNAETGKYGRLRLPERHAGAAMPAVRVIDMKENPPPRQRFLSPPLRAALAETLAAGEQSLLFLNRRGYAPLTLCRTCGYRFQCPSCSAWLVEHKKQGRLQCHHCGHGRKIPPACPKCSNEGTFAACGPGVERIEEEVRELLPAARTLVMASDATATPATIAAAVRAVENREVDVIIGTQIVAKGHHFPALTLVGVVDADLGLSGGDLRAGERTFQLLHQVAGRAGRGERPGRVLLQTFMPRQAVIRALAAGDRDGFLAAERAEREKAAMPPFGRLAALILSGRDERTLDDFCRHLAQRAPRHDDVRVLGPAPAPLAILRGKHRRRFLVKTGKGVALQKYLATWLGPVKIPSSIQLKADIDPQSFF